jgi:hypothetical protein|tara:strand:+ start:378 stop:854 length:477 start_codon:yes stop_codon:yes gene_type:complete
MTDKRYIVTRAIANVISGLSMVTIISLGIMYMSFDNAFVFQNTEINVVNNPIEKGQDIEFYMVGSKKYECNSTAAYGVAHAVDGSHSHNLNKFTKRYIQNTAPGDRVENGWHMAVPDDMQQGGEYRVSMTGEFTCIHMIFKTHKKQVFDNIYLKVDPR